MLPRVWSGKSAWHTQDWKSALYALLAAVFSVPVFAAIAVLLSPIACRR